MTSEDYINKLMELDFYREGIHPEFRPFVGSEYSKHRILQIGESHYIPNYPEGSTDNNGNPREITNEITLTDFDGWWNGSYSDKLREITGWFNTSDVVKWYLEGYRDHAHGIFTNTLKSFCKIVTPNEAFESISTVNSQKYNYFAFMNFYQQPSIYYGENFTNALYIAGEYLGRTTEEIDALWYDIFDRSVAIVESVIDVLEPKAIVITSTEVQRYYKAYGSVDQSGARQKGRYFDDDRIIWLDHPGSAWWNRVKKDATISSKEQFENRLRDIYCINENR